MSNNQTANDQAINLKFEEFIKGLLELSKIRETLYVPLQEKVARGLATLSEKNEYSFGPVTGVVVFDPEDATKVIRTSITYPEGQWWDFEDTLKKITWMCDQVTASKVPEPEVLITSVDESGKKIYKLSREWINWHRVIFPEYRKDGAIGSAAWYAGKKHFQRGPADRIEHSISPLSLQTTTGDVDVEFFRITRENL